MPVVAQTAALRGLRPVANAFGASVGLEAGYTQAASGVSSWLGQRLGLRRGDLRLLVGCGAAGAIALHAWVRRHVEGQRPVRS